MLSWLSLKTHLNMKQRIYIIYYLLIALYTSSSIAQDVDIKKFSIDKNGQAIIEIKATADKYYVLYAKHEIDGEEFAVSMTLGVDGNLELSESVAAYPEEQYRVESIDVNKPKDYDRDGIDDITELNNIGRMSPFNRAPGIQPVDGKVALADEKAFSDLSYQGKDVIIDTHLTDLQFVKFYVLGANTDTPYLYFMNTVLYRAHFMFAEGIGLSSRSDGINNIAGSMRGEIVYHPKVEAPNGKLGVYRFEFEPEDSYSFEEVQRIYELLAANMPFLENNWSYYPMPIARRKYDVEKSLYDNSRVKILLEENVFDQVDYIAMNIEEGYGLLRVMNLDERPNAREIVLYETLPNELPRVAGIITTVTQTPLSHVNLRAIQDKLPNAFIRNASEIKEIDDLIGKYVYYRVSRIGYTLREATIEEVDEFYENSRPTETQVLQKDLSVTGILPLDQVTFDMSTSVGVKAANMATMRTFGFPEGTIRNGFAVPFYFYDEFMKHNNFYADALEIFENEDFKTDFDIQEEMLKDFRKKIKNGEMPAWMLDELDAMHKTWPEGISVRTRSSTNNEDLPGFSGAGLYDSKTQKPDEGHIEKSIKEVYASMWNFRAFDEREFYRIDHFDAAMGVLVHQNFSNEQANGVGVSTDPINGTQGTYFINTQVGEDLVTNPEAFSLPEEILLNEEGQDENIITLIRQSNQIEDQMLVMEKEQYVQLRDYLKVIHDEFKVLYGAQDQDDFAMEIEYKITRDNTLAIKQARPWVDFWLTQAETTAVDDVIQPNVIALKNIPNPFTSSTRIEFNMPSLGTVHVNIYNESGQLVNTITQEQVPAQKHIISLDNILSDHAKGIIVYDLIIITENKIISTFGKMIKL